MDPIVSAALETWTPNAAALVSLGLAAAIYLRGWRARRRLITTSDDVNRLLAFLSGLAALALALCSPLEALDGLFLSAHMTQHLLLLMVGPPLLLLAQPAIPLLMGLPRRLVKGGLGPFLTSPVLRRAWDVVTAMPVTWILFALSTLLWHLPRFYEVALREPFWHNVQHACFFWSGVLFWWPVLHDGARRRWPEWAVIPYLLFSDIVNTALSAYFIFSGSTLYPSYAAHRLSLLSAQDDQALAGAIMWVPGSLVYLLPAIVFAARLLGAPQREKRVAVTRMPRGGMRAANVWTKRLPGLRRVGQWTMLALSIVVIAEGIWGTPVAPLNSAGVLPWVYWRALAIVALLVAGNVFCAVCPFVLFRDLGRRFLPARLRWPRALRNKWLPIALLIAYLWSYEAFSLWSSPILTVWIIAAYFGAALVIDGVFRGATFCKYVCPIGQFHFVTSLISPREVKVRRPEVCGTCKTFDCIRGNAQARGCELDLFQPRKESSLDCTFCMDCVKACPHDNVAVLPVLPAETLTEDRHRSSIGRLGWRNDYAALAMAVVFGAFVNAAGMIGPVMTMEHRWHPRLGPGGMKWAVALFTALGTLLVPAAVALFAYLLVRNGQETRRLLYTLVPIGAAVWAAHLLYHLTTVTSGGLPGWVTPAQMLLLDAGVLWTMYISWRLARRWMVWAPWSALALGLYGLGTWILLQPMEMRGMMH